MRIRRLFATLFGSLVVMGVSVAMAQKAAVDPAPRPLEPDVVAVRLLLGVGDEAPQNWSGRASVDRGEIVATEGVRFREGDEVTGRNSWKAESCLVRRSATAKAAAKAARQGETAGARQGETAGARQGETAGARQGEGG